MIGVIADDLTGAAELGAVGLRHGWRAEIIVWKSNRRRPGRPRFDARNAPDLVCLTTDSRSLSPGKAAARAASAARWLKQVGADLIYKKTDSVLRGQVIPELEAIMRTLRRRRALLLPANPLLGRTIRDGKYFIRGVPIHQTDFARDPEFPRRSAFVVRLLSPVRKTSIRVLPRYAALGSTGIFVGEVSTPAHVCQWISRREPDTLLAGGAETFSAVLRSYRRQKAKHLSPKDQFKPRPYVGGYSELFVCGSASSSCREFVIAAKQSGERVIGLPKSFCHAGRLNATESKFLIEEVLAALKFRHRVILHPGLPLIRDRIVASRLARQLAEIASAIIAHNPPARVFAEGGETAAALLHSLGWTQLMVRQEMSPGVATLQAKAGGPLLTIKPGSYLWPKAILKPLRPH